MQKFCQDRVVIITGAGGGLGAAHAKMLASQGAKVVINDINQVAAEQVVDEIISSGGEAVFNTANITDFADSKRSVEQAISEFGARRCRQVPRWHRPRDANFSGAAHLCE